MTTSLIICAAWVATVTHPVKDDATHQMLIDAAREPDPVVQEAADAALESIRTGILAPAPPPAPPWPAVLAEHPAIQLRALSADAAAGRSQEVIRYLVHRETIVREEALAAIRRGRVVAAVPKLLPLLADPDEGVRLAAFEALAVLAPELDAPARAIDAVIAQLGVEPSFQACEAAVAVLAGMPQNQAAGALLSSLRHDRPMVRLVAARAVADRNDADLASSLDRLLTDVDDTVAAAAATSLGKLKNPASQAPLFARLEETPPDVVQEQVAWALGELKAERAVSALSKLVGTGADPVSASAAEALGKIGDPAAITALRGPVKKIKPTMPGTRRESLKALQRLGDTESVRAAWHILVDKIIPTPMGPVHDSTDVREAALRYLAATGDRRIAGSLVEVIAGRDPTTLQAVMTETFRTIEVLGDAQVAETLLADMKITPPAESRPALVAMLKELTGREYRPLPDETHQRYFVESLGPAPYARVPDPPGVAPLE